jgi:MFS family permease
MNDATQDAAPEPRVPGYSWYVLTILVVVYIFNFIDRQIISILAEDIKRDLNITDAELGFLYGTAFGVFYALFGIPLGRLADSWHRVRLMTIGLTLWSAMTALSGFSKNLVHLSAARIGVGIGEATASPCAYSLISDYFPKEKRAFALAIYSSGLFLGGGLSLFIGGLIVERWNAAFPGGGPLGLVGWQAAFLAVGIPGLLLAILVATIREPIRGASEGIVTPTSPTPFKDFRDELVTIIPPFTLIGAARRGMAALAINIAAAALIGTTAWLLIAVTGTVPQWIAVGIGVYAVFSWASALKVRDPATFALIWRTSAFLSVAIAYGLIAFNAYAQSFWSAPYAIRELGETKSVAGFWVGSTGALSGFIGVIMGGRLADAWRKRHPSGRLLVVLIGAVGPVVPTILGFTATTPTAFYAWNFLAGMLASAALGAAAATTQDLVLPRMRGTATATFFIATTMIGLALGPYLAGKISVVTGSLATGVLALLVTAPVSALLIWHAWRAVPVAEATLIERARAAGETIA